MTDEPIPRRDLAALLAELEVDAMPLGAIIDEKLTRVTRAVQDAHAGGKLTITIKIDPGKPQSGQVVVGCSISSKIPEPASEARAFFVRPVDGALTREDPKQLKLRHLDGGKPPPIRIARAVEPPQPESTPPAPEKEPQP